MIPIEQRHSNMLEVVIAIAIVLIAPGLGLFATYMTMGGCC